MTFLKKKKRKKKKKGHFVTDLPGEINLIIMTNTDSSLAFKWCSEYYFVISMKVFSTYYEVS
jgi:hypothetical protein